jgi:hypothetical protein
LRKRIGYLIVLGLLTVIGFGCSFSTARITDAQMAKDVNSDTKEPVNLTTTFSPTDKIVHCVVKMANAPDGTKLKARWIAVKVEGTEPNYKIDEADITSNSATYVDFSLTPGQGGLPPGDYKVDIFLNPDAGKQETPSKTVNFSVKPLETNITKAWLSDEPEAEEGKAKFNFDTEMIYCFINLNEPKPGTKITVKWIATKTAVAEPNYEIASASDTLKPGEGRFTGNLSRPTNGFPAGEYRADIYFNDSKTPDKSLPFTIAEVSP